MISLRITWSAVVDFHRSRPAYEEEPEPEVEEPLYPVSIRGTEIRVGETTVQALLDAGMEVTWSEMTSDMQIEEYVVDPEMELEANSYYSGASIWVTDSTFAHISFCDR